LSTGKLLGRAKRVIIVIDVFIVHDIAPPLICCT
jgi:hypothetical protein